MRIVFIFLYCLITPQYIFSQNNEDATFLTIGKESISKREFERIFNKNNSISSIDKQSVEEYLQMFINFKLKVQAATDAGFDTLSSFRNELKGYRDQLAKSYLTDNSTLDSLIKEAYQRMHTEVNASHIMVSLKINPTPADTLEAWNKIITIRQKLLNGESFEKLALEISEDPSAKNNKGNLGYFTAFQMIYPFESAAYNQKIGDISQPVRTRFGYHLIKTIDKRPAHGEVKVAHIMFMVPQGSPDSSWIAAENKIKDIEKQLKAGADFANLAKEKSEDRGSARNGGELPAFGTGRMVPEFEAAAFNLQFPGDLSIPVKTFYGWHIIKLIERKGIPQFEQVVQDIKSKISRDEREEYCSNSLISKLKKEYSFTENVNLLAELYSSPQIEKTSQKPLSNLGEIRTEKSQKPKTGSKSVSKNEDSKNEKSQITKIETKPVSNVEKPKNEINWNINSLKLQQELFHFDDQSHKLDGFLNYLKTLPAPDSTILAGSFVNNSYSTYVKKVLLEFENNQLELKYPDFKNLINEYHDGILLFNLSDSIVWSKASKDTVGLEKFFENNQANYTWPDRIEATIVNCQSSEIAKKALKETKKLKTPESIEKDLAKAVCDTINKSCIVLTYGKFSKGDNPLIDSIARKKGITPIHTINETYQFAVVHNLLKPSPKSLNDSRGLAISDYQNALDKEWVDKLRKKYTIVVNNEILNQLKNKYAGKN